MSSNLSGQISSLNIGSTKSNNEEQDAATNDNCVTMCANCGKEGGEGSMNSCNKCDLVTYCNVACKKKHRSKHKKKCEKRGAELYDEKLFKDHPPPEECPICFLPLVSDRTAFHPCCGKTICLGCIYAMVVSGVKDICAFCRTPDTEGDQVERLKKLMEKGNSRAFYMLGGYYDQGTMGMPQNWAKANELWLKAGELGCDDAYFNLGNAYEDGEGAEVDTKKAKHYFELAAMNGSVEARHNLGCYEEEAGNLHRALKHFVLAARAGRKESLGVVKKGFMHGIVTKDDYASTLRAYQMRQDESKSDARGNADAYYQLFAG